MKFEVTSFNTFEVMPWKDFVMDGQGDSRYPQLHLWGYKKGGKDFMCPQYNFLKMLWEKDKLLVTSNFSFSHSVFYPFENFLPFSSDLKLLSVNSFSLEESKICNLGKVYKKKVNNDESVLSNNKISLDLE